MINENKLDSNAVAPSENDRFDFIRYQRSDAELDSLMVRKAPRLCKRSANVLALPRHVFLGTHHQKAE